jgi:hypothetical protein
MPKPKKKLPRKAQGKKPPKMAVYSAAGNEASSAASEEQIYASDLTLHDLFAQQTATMLESADLSEEQKQSILVGMSCPCCGAGGMSFTVKLKR